MRYTGAPDSRTLAPTSLDAGCACLDIHMMWPVLHAVIYKYRDRVVTSHTCSHLQIHTLIHVCRCVRTLLIRGARRG